MKRKHALTLLCFTLSLFFSGCTLHFKAKEIEIDSKKDPIVIGKNTTKNITYELWSLDIAKK